MAEANATPQRNLAKGPRGQGLGRRRGNACQKRTTTRRTIEVHGRPSVPSWKERYPTPVAQSRTDILAAEVPVRQTGPTVGSAAERNLGSAEVVVVDSNLPLNPLDFAIQS